MRHKLFYRLAILLACALFFAFFRILCYAQYSTRGNFKNILTWKGQNVDNNTNWTDVNNLVWFMQISDLHLSIYGHQDRVEDFENFCSKLVIGIVRPQAVFVTGDIFESKYNFLKSSGLNIKECLLYHNILNKTRVNEHVLWRDIRGNHDSSQTFNNDHECYRIGRPPGLNKLGESYQTLIKTNFGVYNFISLDLCPSPGLILPVNFFGTISEETRQFIDEVSYDLYKYNHTIWLGHYPLSFLRSPAEANIIRASAAGSIGYIFGHLHINTNLYARDHESGTLMLELGDWRTNRRFRIIAYDNDILSFKDFYFNRDSDVMILLTNPKNMNYYTPNLEPILRIRTSSHIRALVFTNLVVEKITVFINNGYYCAYSIHHFSGGTFNNSVFTCPWHPVLFDKNLKHYITIAVLTSDHKVYTDEHYFTLDGSYTELSTLSSFLLLYNMPFLSKILFSSFSIPLFTIPILCYFLSGFTIIKNFEYRLYMISPELSQYFLNMSNYTPMLILNIISWVYPMTGPLEYLPGKLGHSTIFGTFVDGKLYPSPVVYVLLTQKFILYDLPMYLHYYFRLYLKSSNERSIIPRVIYRVLIEVFWMMSLFTSLIFWAYRVYPLTDYITSFLSLHTFYPLITIYLRIRMLKYQTKLKFT